MRFIFPLLVLMLLNDVASGALMVQESFDYAPGTRPVNGVLGWKQGWGSDPLATTSNGLDYADGNGNSLQVAGNAGTRPSNCSTQIEAVRDFQDELIDTYWFSFLIKSATGNETVSLGINESFYVGQGAKDVTSTSYGVYDADTTQLGSIAIFAGTEISLLVGRAVYDQSQDKFSHLDVWLNPVLDTQPDVLDATTLYSGAIKEFDKVPKIALYHTSTLGALDELCFGDSFADVTAFTSAGPAAAVPEPSMVVMLGSLIPLMLLLRRKKVLAPRAKTAL